MIQKCNRLCGVRFMLMLTIFTLCTPLSASSFMGDMWERATGFFSRSKKDTLEQKFLLPTNSVINIKNKEGDITIIGTQGATGPAAYTKVTTVKKGSEDQLKQTKIVTHHDGSVLSIEVKSLNDQAPAYVAIALDIPTNTSASTTLNIDQGRGHIAIKGIPGDTNIRTNQGSITLEEMQGGITARAPQGSVKASLVRLPANSSIFIDALEKITLIIPKKTRATLNAHSVKGTITTDQHITLKPMTMRLNNKSKKHFWNQIQGMLGAHSNTTDYLASTIVLESVRGKISIKEE
ncbi:MAG: hypothetical protein JW725_02445 [Candidatus Babeliaceae bacterium]|nr:hypothetical protein [Candidatus Babeliaceae bacterium]